MTINLKQRPSRQPAARIHQLASLKRILSDFGKLLCSGSPVYCKPWQYKGDPEQSSLTTEPLALENSRLAAQQTSISELRTSCTCLQCSQPAALSSRLSMIREPGQRPRAHQPISARERRCVPVRASATLQRCRQLGQSARTADDDS